MTKRCRPAALLTSVLGALLLFTSCSPAQPSTLEEIAARALPYADTAEKASVVDGVNAFSVDLYRQLGASRDGNLFFSPFSIGTALAMTYAGARGGTEAQMASVLHFTLGQSALHPAFGALIGDMKAAGAREGYTLAMANGVWGQSEYAFQTDFLAILRDSYGAPLQTADFITQTETVRSSINNWVSDQTAGKILDLLPSGSIDGATRMVLANAIHFKGTWARTFESEDTAAGAFHLSIGSSATVPMMRQEARFRFAMDELAKVLELPYTTGDLSMIILLPLKTDGLAELTAAMTPARLKTWLAALSPVPELPVSIPRFRFTADFRLKTELSAMGMDKAFDPAAADFSGIATADRLFLGNVFHKAFVEVNEEGTEAAAATAVTVGLTAAPMEDFIADHPFLFLIRHNRSGVILFLGRLTDPR